MTDEIRRAASLLAGRDGETGLELLVLERSAGSRFLPGYVAFPGGSVDEDDAERRMGEEGQDGGDSEEETGDARRHEQPEHHRFGGEPPAAVLARHRDEHRRVRGAEVGALADHVFGDEDLLVGLDHVLVGALGELDEVAGLGQDLVHRLVGREGEGGVVLAGDHADDDGLLERVVGDLHRRGDDVLLGHPRLQDEGIDGMQRYSSTSPLAIMMVEN